MPGTFDLRSIRHMRIACLPFLAAGLMLLAVPGFAHHGTGVSYDASKPVTLKGTVTEFRYANPHPQLYFDVTDDQGKVGHIEVELRMWIRIAKFSHSPFKGYRLGCVVGNARAVMRESRHSQQHQTRGQEGKTSDSHVSNTP